MAYTACMPWCALCVQSSGHTFTHPDPESAKLLLPRTTISIALHFALAALPDNWYPHLEPHAWRPGVYAPASGRAIRRPRCMCVPRAPARHRLGGNRDHAVVSNMDKKLLSARRGWGCCRWGADHAPQPGTPMNTMGRTHGADTCFGIWKGLVYGLRRTDTASHGQGRAGRQGRRLLALRIQHAHRCPQAGHECHRRALEGHAAQAALGPWLRPASWLN